MLRSLGTIARGKPDTDGLLALQLIIGSIPLGLAGLVFADYIETNLRSPLVIATTTAVFGVALWLSDRPGRGSLQERGLTWRNVVFIGVAQVLALIPGTSRSGITMTAALAVGLTREAAGRFAFLLSMPAIVMAAGWQTLQLIAEPEPLPWTMLTTATVLSALVAFMTIALFLKLIGRIGMVWFAGYRFVLAGILFYVFV